jgi:hypothetical protein
MDESTFVQRMTQLQVPALSPAIVVQVANAQPVAPTQNLPLINSRTGSIMADRFDANLRWYIPVLALVNDPDPAFAFDAVQAGVSGHESPFNRAALTFDLRPVDPPDLAAARAAAPAQTFSPVPLNISATLVLPYTADDGSAQTATATGQITAQADGTQRIVFNVQGPPVIDAYQQLTNLGAAGISLVLTYDAWQQITRTIRQWVPEEIDGGPIEPIQPIHPVNPGDPAHHIQPFQVAQPLEQMTPLAPRTHIDLRNVQTPVEPIAVESPTSQLLRMLPNGGGNGNGNGGGGGPHIPPHPFPLPPHPLPGHWVTVTEQDYVATAGQDTQNVALALTFHTDAYRPLFTITTTVAGVATKRPIIDVSDLAQFATRRSEYQELTSLGDVPTRYPSFRRLYLGQVSGTVVAIPASYGIVRGHEGTAAHCEAVVDPSSLSGCRFQFTFTLAPDVDPIDLAQLALDLPSIPEAAGRSLQLTLPSGLDPSTPPTLGGFSSADAHFADGVDPHTILAQVTIADNQTTPAITIANLFLNQLTINISTPIFGSVAVRLDDEYTPPVQTSVLLNLRATAGSDDLAIAVTTDAPPAAVATNQSPFDLQLLRSAVLGQHALTVSPLGGVTLASGQTASLPGDVTSAVAVLVARTLALPAPLPKAGVFDYVSFHTATIQEVQHTLAVDATVVSFDPAKVTELDVSFSIATMPGVVVPSITLTQGHRVDFVHVTVPINSLFSGLTTTVAITVIAASGQHQVSLTHDFLDDPIFTISDAQLA